MSRPLQIAHRGGAGLWPENTIEAFERAIASGIDGIEIDVHLSRDGQLVVHHDERLNPDFARGSDGAWISEPAPLIKDLTVDELRAYDVGRARPGTSHAARHPERTPFDGARIPLLADVYDLVAARSKPRFRLYVELKTALLDPFDFAQDRPTQSADPAALAETAVALTREQGVGDLVTFVSFDWRSLVRAKELAPEIPNAFTTLPFFLLDPDDESAASDEPGSRREAARRASAGGAPWCAGFDWRDQAGATFAERMLRAIAAGPADGWFAWHGDVTPVTAALARDLGLAVSCWTVDDEAEMSRLAGLNVEAILTDRPGRLARALERY